MDGFGLFGVVKETGVDDEGLTTFYNDFFSYPLYRDADMVFYNALGDRRLSVPWWNPYALFKGAFAVLDIMARLKKKNIQGNLAGEGIIKGGVIVFDKDGKQRYAYLEEVGSEIPVEDILAAMESVKVGKE